MKTETGFRKWLIENYGIQDYNAYIGTQAEEIAIQYSASLLQERDTLKKDVEFLRGKINEIEKEHRENGHARLKVEEANKELIAVLEKISNWRLPETDIKWADGTPMSFGAAYGSNGERDYIKSLAASALLKHRKG